MAYDINKILEEYGEEDFGFTAVDEAEYQAVIAEKDETVGEYMARLKQRSEERRVGKECTG